MEFLLNLQHLYLAALVVMTYVALQRMVAVHDRMIRPNSERLDFHTLSFVTTAGRTIRKQPEQQQQLKETDERQRPRHVSHTGGGGGADGGGEGEGTFGACLKIMDDNHWLVEWLAYHWFALPLRHLIVMIDPKSRTSPIPILDRWKGRMTIVYVNDTYTGARANEIGRAPGNEEHLGPQRAFLADCMRTYKRMDWNWIIATDTDEFVGINPLVRTTRDPDHELYRGDVPIPANNEPGHVMKMLEQELRRRKELNITVKWPNCFAMNRMQICTDELRNISSSEMTPPGFRYQDFLTQRFLLGGEKLRPKDMVSIAAIEASYFERLDLLNQKGANTHNIVPGRCAQGAPRRKSVFQAYHYDGTEEQRRFRADPRGQYGKRMGTSPQEPGSCPKFVADDVRPWLAAFVETVGQEEAERLLEGNGRVHSWPAYGNTNAATN